MKSWLVILALGFAAAGAQAQTTSSRLALAKTCEQEAGNRRGADRKAFVQACTADARKQQQARTRVCTEETKAQKGRARDKAMKACLKRA